MPKSKIWNGSSWITLDANNADTVGGKKADNTANNLLVLDASAKVPVANIPAVLTGKDADTVDGKHGDNTANNLLVLDASAKVPVANIPSTINADTVDGKHGDNTANNLLVLDAGAKVSPTNLPVATSTAIGAVKQGSKISIDAGGIISVSGLVPTDISGFDAQVQTSKLNQMSAPVADVNMNNQKLTNLASPLASSDAASKGYVDAAIQGLDIKDSVEAVTTVNLNAAYAPAAKTLTASANGVFSIDGVTPLAGARILVKDQTAASQNGIYVISAAGSTTTLWVLTRASDFNSNININAGAFVFVTGGAQNGLTGWVLTSPNDNTLVMDTTAISFTQFSGAGSFIAGTGLTRTGNTLSLNPASATALGGVKTGANVSIDASGVISVAAPYVHPANHPVSMITGLAAVATSGSYTDLTNKPLPGKISVSAATPVSPAINDIWFDMN